MSRRHDSELNTRAVDIFRDELPAPPNDLDHAVLSAVRRESSARRGAPLARAGAQRHFRLTLHLRRAAAGIALALGLIALACPVYGPSPEPSLAVASVAFTSQCASHGDHAGQAGDGRIRADARLVVAGAWDGREASRFQRVLALFARKTGAQVTYAYQTHGIADTIRQRLDRDCPPDVALLPQPGLLRDLATRAQLRPLDPTVRRLVRRNYTPRWRRLATVNGKLYGVWFKAANKSTFWFSHRAFDRAGAHRPRTWQQLKEVAERLRAAGITPFSVGGADGWTLTDWFENVYLATAGPRRYDALARHKLPWTHPTVILALKRLAEVLRRSDWLAGGTSGALKTTFNQSVDHVFGPSKRAAIMYEGDFVANLIPARPQGESSDIGIFPFPPIDHDRAPIVVGGDIAALFTSHPLARELMRFLATPEAAMPWARAGGFISPNRSVNINVYRDTYTRALARAVNSADSHFDLSDLQPPSFGATATQGIWKILQRYLRRSTSTHAISQQLQAAAYAATPLSDNTHAHTAYTATPRQRLSLYSRRKAR